MNPQVGDLYFEIGEDYDVYLVLGACDDSWRTSPAGDPLVALPRPKLITLNSEKPDLVGFIRRGSREWFYRHTERRDEVFE